jgi:hypothetical protein
MLVNQSQSVVRGFVSTTRVMHFVEGERGGEGRSGGASTDSEKEITLCKPPPPFRRCFGFCSP